MSNYMCGPWHSVKATKLSNPTQAILIAEGEARPAGGPWHHVATWDADPSGRVSQLFKDNIAWNRHVSGAARGLTNAGLSNYLFVDGHVEPLTWDQTWQPIGGKVTIGGTDVPYTMWRQNYSTDVCPLALDLP
jgi:prepilin-type processing-associated H-X9-DG protein